ncbi:Electron transport complex subunit [Saliniradius amylolyticus]|uniref:Ion-translocating oxidoreductase complex subunit G n=1 Tax=Saliniradius amylolyticus TaxID=2183582 RepID=A0A2S2E1C0_9ALTE|nr:electron transport complex subunit RsxG [Saliniradius amylolyticus]AWL11434.1 Electron transport complex subunit [Saliniradius amylolyticus]
MLKNMRKNGGILGAFAIVTTGLIALTYELTSPVIHSQELRERQQTLNRIIPSALHDNALTRDCTLVTEADLLGNAKPKRVYRARLGGEPRALAIQTLSPNGYNGNIHLLVGVDTTGAVTGVRVTRHQETPGLGDKVETRISDWILSFDGKRYTEFNADSWAVEKDGGSFDQFTGATITPRAVVSAVKKALIFAQQNEQALFRAPNECNGETRK